MKNFHLQKGDWYKIVRENKTDVIILEKSDFGCDKLCEAIEEAIPEGKTSVGIELNITHVSATPVGLEVRAEAEVMIPNGYGKIINTGSICGHVIWPDPQLPYSVSKAAVIHMTKAAGAELIKHGIRVNCISPGVTKVADLFPEVVDVFFKTAPIDRFGSPEDHQGAAVFLASEVSDFMVGQEIVLDGGYTIM